MVIFVEKAVRTKTPDLFEVPYLRPSDNPSKVLLSAQKVASLCSVRVMTDYKDENLRTVYFDAVGEKGGTYPLFTFSRRTVAEADALVKDVLKAMRNWSSFGSVSISVGGLHWKG